MLLWSYIGDGALRCSLNLSPNVLAVIKQEYGWEGIFLMCKWEKLEKKMSDFRNHRRFTIKCLKNDLVPVSVRLKTNIRTTKGLEIIRKAEKTTFE